MKITGKKYSVLRVFMVTIILVECIVFVQFKYDWRYLYAGLRLTMLDRSIVRDSRNESLYKERMEFCRKNLTFRKQFGLDSILEHDIDMRIQLGTKDTAIYLSRFYGYLTSGEDEKALVNITSAINNGAHDYIWYRFRQSTYGHLGMYDSAIADIRRDSGQYGVDNSLIGKYYTRLGRYETAMDAFRKDNDVRHLAQLLLMNGRDKEVVSIASRNDIESFRAIAVYHSGNSSEAKRICLNIIEKDSSDCRAPFFLSKM